jgi:hypothetical protein
VSGARLSEYGGEGPYRNGKVYVCSEMCETCVFRPGNQMHLRPGRLKQLIAENIENDAGITCHKTLLQEERAVCRGFFDRYKTTPLRLAEALSMIEYLDPPKENHDG